MSFNWIEGEDARIKAGGHSLECRSWGPPPDEAPTIIMLHEGLGCLELWRDFPARLAEATGFGVFAYSRAGYGASDPVTLPRPLDYMSREALNVLPEILDQIGAKRVILLGHSDGASIAAIHAGSLADYRVRALVLIAPHFFTESAGLAEIASARDAYEKGDLRERLAKYHQHVDNAFWGWNKAWLDPRFAAWDISEVIDYLRVPALAVQGLGDQYGSLAQLDELEERSYAPVERVHIEGCRHLVHIEHPDRLLSETAQFCARLERIEAAMPET